MKIRVARTCWALLIVALIGVTKQSLVDASGATDVLNLREAPFSAKGDGVADDTEALKKAIEVATERYGTVVIPPGIYVLTSPIRISGKRNFRVRGGGGGVGELSAVSIKWNGPAGVAAIVLDRVRDAEFAHFSLVPGSREFEVGIEIGQFSNPGPWISTHNTFRSLHVRGGTTAGIRLSRNASDNNELHTFEDVTLNGAGRYGIYIGGMQSKWHRILGGSIAEKDTGIYVHQGSFVSFGTNFSHNKRDVHLRQPVDAILIEAAQSEGASRFLTTDAYTAAWAVTVKASRLSPGALAPNGIYVQYMAGGPLVLIGNDFADGVSRPAWRLAASNHYGTPRTTVVAIGNVFPNETPFRDSDTKAVLSIGNVWVDQNNAKPLPTRLGREIYVPASNLRGSFTVAGTAVSAAVSFHVAERDEKYFLSITPSSRVGTPAAGSNRVLSVKKLTSGFTATVEVPPGAGNVVTFDWLLIR